MRTVPTKSLALFASCVALLLPNPSGAQNDVDLDQLTQEHVAYALNAELDDVYERLNANQLHDLNNIFNAIMHALSDAGDDHSEQTIDMEDLVEEMQEAGLSLGDVVAGAVQRADEYSANGRWGIVPVLRQDRQRESPSPGFAALNLAVQNTQSDLTQVIQSTRPRRLPPPPPRRTFP